MSALVEFATSLVIFCCLNGIATLPSEDRNEKSNLNDSIESKNLNAIEVSLNIADLERQDNTPPETRLNIDDAHLILHQNLEDIIRKPHVEDLFTALPYIALQLNDDENLSIPKIISDNAYKVYMMDSNGDPFIPPVQGTIDKPRNPYEIFEENLAKLQLREQNRDKHFPLPPTLDDGPSIIYTFKDFLSSLFGEEPPPTDFPRNVHPIGFKDNLCKDKTVDAIIVPLNPSLQELQQIKGTGSSESDEAFPQSRFTVGKRITRSKKHRSQVTSKVTYRRAANDADDEEADDDTTDAEQNAEAVEVIKEIADEADDSDNDHKSDEDIDRTHKRLISRLAKKLPRRFTLKFIKKLFRKRFLGSGKRAKGTRLREGLRSLRKRYRARFRMYDDGVTSTVTSLPSDPGTPTAALQEALVEPVVRMPRRRGRMYRGGRRSRRTCRFRGGCKFRGGRRSRRWPKRRGRRRTRRGRKRRGTGRRFSRRSADVQHAVEGAEKTKKANKKFFTIENAKKIFDFVSKLYNSTENSEAIKEHNDTVVVAKDAIVKADEANEALRQAKEYVEAAKSAEEKEVAKKDLDKATEEQKAAVVAAEEAIEDAVRATKIVKDVAENAGLDPGFVVSRRSILAFLGMYGQNNNNLQYYSSPMRWINFNSGPLMYHSYYHYSPYGMVVTAQLH